jgi:hypothetical protein
MCVQARVQNQVRTRHPLGEKAGERRERERERGGERETEREREGLEAVPAAA